MKKLFTLYSRFSLLFTGIILISSCRQSPVDSENNNTTTEETEPGSTPEASYSNIYNKYKGKNQIINTNEEELDVFFNSNGSLKAPEQIDADNFTEEKVNKLNNLLDENNKMSDEEKGGKVKAKLVELRGKSQLDGNNQKITAKINDLEKIEKDLKDKKKVEQKKCQQCNNVLTNKNGTLTCLICNAAKAKKAADDKKIELEKAKTALQNEKDEAKKKEKQKEIERLQQEQEEKDKQAKQAEEARIKADELKKEQEEKDKQAEEARKLESEARKSELIDEINLIKNETVNESSWAFDGQQVTLAEKIALRLDENLSHAKLIEIIGDQDKWSSFLKLKSENGLKTVLAIHKNMLKEEQAKQARIKADEKEKKKEQGEQNKIPETAPIKQENKKKLTKEELIAEINDFYNTDKDVVELRNKLKNLEIGRIDVSGENILYNIISFDSITKLNFDFQISMLNQLVSEVRQRDFYFELDKVLKKKIKTWHNTYKLYFDSYTPQEPKFVNNSINEFYESCEPILKNFYGIDIKDIVNIQKDFIMMNQNLTDEDKKIKSFDKYLNEIGILGSFADDNDNTYPHFRESLQKNVEISPNLRDKAVKLIKKLEALKTQSGE